MGGGRVTHPIDNRSICGPSSHLHHPIDPSASRSGVHVYMYTHIYTHYILFSLTNVVVLVQHLHPPLRPRPRWVVGGVLLCVI